MSAFGGKADIERDPSECLLMTQNGLCHPPQSEALQSDPTNACGGVLHPKVDYKITKLDKFMPWNYRQF